jgi:hypothetical protein
MASKKAAQLIKKALPGATIVKAQTADGALIVRSDAATPDAAALLRKYGGAEITRSSSRKFDAAVGVETDLEVAIVQLKSSTEGAPSRLNRRTVVVNKKTGKIESMSG